MAFSSHSPREVDRRGFATAASMIWCLALSLAATAVLVASTNDLRTAKLGLQRAGAEARLDEAQVIAAATVLSDSLPGNLAWTLGVDGEEIQIVAEPEAEKMSWRAALADFQPVVDLLQPENPARARAGLAALAATQDGGSGDIAGLDSSPQWTACAASILSRQGESAAPDLTTPRPPGPTAPTWRIGQVWRIRATQPSGLAETRILRFTGAPKHPWAIVERRLTFSKGNGPKCTG